MHEIWADYETTLLFVHPVDQPSYVVGAAAEGITGVWPFDTADAWVITAFNPRSEPLTAARNAERHEQLREALAAAGYEPIESVGRQPDGEWEETGFVVPGIDETTVTALAEQFEQNALFHWTPDAWSIHGVLQPGRRRFGWHLSPAVAARH